MFRTFRSLFVAIAFTVAAGGHGSGVGAVNAAELPRRPNIVLLLADDLGASDLACYGADLHETPRLDRFAAESVKFTQAYAMSVCSPTRAAIMTGKHAARLHLTIWREGTFSQGNSKQKLRQPDCIHDLPLKETTIAELLHQAGYATYHVGKWHLGDADHYPENQGFDVNIGGTHWGAPDTFFYPFSGDKRFEDRRYVPGLGVGKPGDYLTDRLTDEALRLIDQTRDRPFFLNLWFHNSHTPIEAKPGEIEHFKSLVRDGLHHRNATYAGMIHTLDQNVGRVLDYLKAQQLDDKTLVLFGSDNGGYVGKYDNLQVTDNYPLRSGKGSLYEGGVRVPLIVRWPGVTTAGRECATPVLCTDLFRTLADAAGVSTDANAAGAADGVSLVPLLRDPGASLDRHSLYFHYPHYYATTSPVSAVRNGDWKLLHYYEDGRSELFDLKADPGEAKELAAQRPDLVKSLGLELEAWLHSVDAQLPTLRSPAR